MRLAVLNAHERRQVVTFFRARKAAQVSGGTAGVVLPLLLADQSFENRPFLDAIDRASIFFELAAVQLGARP